MRMSLPQSQSKTETLIEPEQSRKDTRQGVGSGRLLPVQTPLLTGQPCPSYLPPPEASHETSRRRHRLGAHHSPRASRVGNRERPRGTPPGTQAGLVGLGLGREGRRVLLRGRYSYVFAGMQIHLILGEKMAQGLFDFYFYFFEGSRLQIYSISVQIYSISVYLNSRTDKRIIVAEKNSRCPSNVKTNTDSCGGYRYASQNYKPYITRTLDSQS